MSRLSRATLIVFIAFVTDAFAQQQSFTLEQVMSSPFPAELTVSLAGGKVAWVFNAEGKRNIWVAEPSASGEYKSRQVSSYAADDGQDLGELAWTPDASAIVYTRGGDLEFPDRAYPNPHNFVQSVEQDIWEAWLAGGAQLKLFEGHSPAVSPTGDKLAYILKEQVWEFELRAGPPRKGRKDENAPPKQLIKSNGKSSTLRWSPAGSRLAFVSRREDHSFVGVYDFATESVRYLDPSVDQDMEPVWSPDSKRVAFIRVPARTEAFAFGPRRSGQPWSIRVADVETGAGRQVWVANEGRGSVYRGIEAEFQLMWGAGDRLIFPWEGGGWTHLYSVSAAGGHAVLLTPGDYEVEHVSLSHDRKEVLFSSNRDDIDRRHIGEVSVLSGPPTAVTRGAGLEWSPVETSDGRAIVVLHSDARRPARPAITVVAGEIRDLAPEAIPADFPDKQLVEPQQVIFSAGDGLKIHGQLFLPASAADGKRHPAVVFFHGGSRRQMLLGWHYMAYYHNAYAQNQYLASRGYIVLSVNYRSGIGYGLDFREALNYGAAGASEFNDVLGAGLYLRSRPDVDPQKIGLWGGSYGGYLTALGLARASDLFAAGVDLHGVHDWNLEIPNFMPAYNPERQQDEARVAWESSPLASIKTWRSPVLLVQGDDDRNVPFAEMVHMVEALRQQGVEFKQLVFPDEIHDFLLHRTWLAAYHAAANFFDEHLKDLKAGGH